jgi:hypothetical protein
MKSIAKFCLIFVATAAVTCLTASAQTTNTTTTTNTPPAHRSTRPDYSGKVSAVDGVTMTLTVSGKTGDVKVKVTSKTKITKNRQPATFADITEGETVSGRGTKDADGTWQAATLRVTAPKAKPAAAPAQ